MSPKDKNSLVSDIESVQLQNTALAPCQLPEGEELEQDQTRMEDIITYQFIKS